jgi:ergothioneine biosynthesis protein EgtB
VGSQLSGEELLSRFREVRAAMRKAAAPLSAEDMLVQSMPDASPTKWHLAHTTWFYETFLLSDSAFGNYKPYHPSFGYLFNSYYDAVGERHPRPKRGLLTRPSVKEVFEYRAHVEAEIAERLSRLRERDFERLRPVIELGINHEQQHLELLYTDIKHAFAQNPLRPAYREVRSAVENPNDPLPPPIWIDFNAGVRHVGHAGDHFAFDNEGPSHRVFLEAFELASRPVSCGEYLKFMSDGGYDRPDLWLSDGWAAKNHHGWIAPLYWEQAGTEWAIFTLEGLRRLNRSEPICHVSFYEADAYARWASARLPTEFEWEIASSESTSMGTLLEDDRLHPGHLSADLPLASMIGDVWEWTQSPYVSYPGYRPLAGALGEYNGKFMCNQMVLKGGSCVTPRSHIRPTYRNFFSPEARWQFTGLRLARST